MRFFWLTFFALTTIATAQDPKKVQHYPTKFELIKQGSKLPELMKQVDSKDARLAFESKSAVRWIVKGGRVHWMVLREYAGEEHPAAVRILAVELLAEMPGGMPRLMAGLAADADPRVALLAVGALGRMRAVNPLLDLASWTLGDVQNAVYLALGELGEKVALPTLLGAARKGNAAAIEALGGLGHIEAVGVLEGQVSKGSRGAFTALVRLYAKKSPKHLPEAWPLAKDDPQRLEVVRAMGAARIYNLKILDLLSRAAKRDPAMRPVAHHAILAIMEAAGSESAAPFVRSVLVESNDRIVTIRALAGCARCRDKEAVALIFPKMGSRDQNIRTTAIAAVREIPGEKARVVLVTALGHEPDPFTQKMLIEALGQRGEVASAKTLLEWMTPDEGPPDVKLAAYKAYADIADNVAGAKHQSIAHIAPTMYLRVLDSPVRERALRGLAKVGEFGSIEPILAIGKKYPDARQVSIDAATAIARRLERKGDRKNAVAAYRLLYEAGAEVGNNLRRLGEKVEMRARGGRIHAWWVHGPIKTTMKDWAKEEGPERGPIDLEAWKPVAGGGEGAAVDFNSMMTPNDDVAAYAYSEIFVKKERAAVLRCGSDDGIRVWINGKLVHDKLVLRGLTIDEDTVPVKLQEGWNKVLVKVCEKGGGWAFHVRLQDEKGRPLKFRIR